MSTITNSCLRLRSCGRRLGAKHSCLQRTLPFGLSTTYSHAVQNAPTNQENDDLGTGRESSSQITRSRSTDLGILQGATQFPCNANADVNAEASVFWSPKSQKTEHMSSESTDRKTEADKENSDAKQASEQSLARNPKLLTTDEARDARAQWKDALIFQQYKDSKRRAVAYEAKLEKEVVWASGHRGVRDVQEILQLLVEKYAVEPTAVHYEAMIRANGDAEHGSIESVKKILQEMEQENMIIGTSIYQAVLSVLAVHPDHLFHAEIEQKLQSQWVPGPHPSVVDKVSFLTRSGQLELAVLHLNKLYEARHHLDPQSLNPDSVPIPDYLLPSLLYLLTEHQDFSGVLYLLYTAEDWRVHLPTTVYKFLLDIAVENHHLDLVKYVWRKTVEETHVVPLTTSCHAVLLTASRAGDVSLAERVHDVLSKRRVGSIVVPDIDDGEIALWDLLEQTYLAKGDTDGAKEVKERRQRFMSTTKHISTAQGEGVVREETNDGPIPSLVRRVKNRLWVQ